MKRLFFIIACMFSTIIFSQNNNNSENRQDISKMNDVKGDSLLTNTYNLEMNLDERPCL